MTAKQPAAATATAPRVQPSSLLQRRLPVSGTALAAGSAACTLTLSSSPLPPGEGPGVRAALPTTLSVPAPLLSAPITLQPKLTVNTPGDKYEQEADRVAAMVMRMSDPMVSRTAAGAVPVTASDGKKKRVQRQCATCAAKEHTSEDCPDCKKKKLGLGGTLQRLSAQGDSAAGMAAPPIVSRVLSTPGSPLPGDTRTFMESRFGTDFSHVRVHTDSVAAESAGAVAARAYTVGQHIAFGSGQFSPGSQSGQMLLAHELTHVVQQGNAPSDPILQRSFLGSVLGGLGGGLIGGIAGGLAFGPIGAVAGSIAGLVAGAATGDSVTDDERPLNPDETNAATLVFGASIDLSRVRIAEDAPVLSLSLGIQNNATTPFETIYFPPGAYSNNLPWLIHELTHVWQTQHGIGVFQKIVAAMKGNYDYGGEAALRSDAAANKRFVDYNTEQQGAILANYYSCMTVGHPWQDSHPADTCDLSAYQPFVDQVRTGGASTPSRPTGDDRSESSERRMQLKLTVNTPGDKYEQEADRVADMVMRMPEPSVQRECATCAAKGHASEDCPECKKKKQGLGGTLQRLSTQGDSAAGMAAPPIVSRVLASSGEPLGSSVRKYFEPRFGCDLSSVRIHEGHQAEDSAKSVQARAYTVGNNIVLGAGESASASQLMAHELTHVVQQTKGVQSLQRAPENDTPGFVTLPEVTVYGDPHFYKRAKAGNLRYAASPPAKGWPFDPELRLLWQAKEFDKFALAISDYQQQGMGEPEDSADGILGPMTAKSLQSRPQKTWGDVKKEISNDVAFTGTDVLRDPRYLENATKKVGAQGWGAPFFLSLSLDTSLIPSARIDRNDVFLKNDPLGGTMVVYWNNVYMTRVAALSAMRIADANGGGPHVTFYLDSDGLILPSVLSVTTAPRVVETMQKLSEQDQADAKAMAELAENVLWWYVGARAPLRLKAPAVAEDAALLKNLPRSGPIPQSVGAMSRAEHLARKLGMNVNSQTTRQVLNSLDDSVQAFVSQFRKGSILRELPGEVLEMSVEKAIQYSSKARKLLIDTRFVK